MKVFAIIKDDKILGIFDTVTPLLVFVSQYAKEFGFDEQDKDLFYVSTDNLAEEVNACMTKAKVVCFELNCDYYSKNDKFRYGKNVQITAKGDQHYIWTAQMNDDTNYTVTAPYKCLAIEEAITQHINEHGVYSGVKVIKK